MKINTIELIISAVRESQYPTDNKEEFLLVGRSNVGKSSFINTIINRKNYARTSSTPGKTQTLNFYKINDSFYLVDAPGYGFAKVRNSLKKKFGLIMESYLKSRENLKMVFLLVDFRHKPTSDDIMMYDYLKYYNVPVTIICTKVDKVSKNNHAKNKNIIQKELNLPDDKNIILFSSVTKIGKNEVYEEIEKQDFTTQLNIIDLKKEDEEKEEETEEKILEKSEMEAKAVANRIRKLFEDNYCVYDKKEGYRKATFKDIVILLRTTSDTAKVYEKELTQNGFPTFTDTGSNYFETEEIQIILSALKIIDNPNNDIPLVTVLRSPIGGFTDNELIEIRLEERNGLFYQALETTKEKSQNLELKNKVNKFLNMLNDWQLKQEYLSLDELIWYIYESTNYYNFVSSKPNGELKTANLKLLFEKAKDYEKASFKGLYNFINYIDKISKGSDDMGSAKLIRRK